VVGLVQKFYVGSPLGDLNPLSSLSIKKTTSIFNWPDNWQHRDYEDAFEMMVRRCGGCVPSCLFLGATELKSCKKKKKVTDKQTDLTVIWDTKSTRTDFLSNPKSVDRKTKKLDRRADRQSADLIFWDTL
jgi:hypothetical protein